MAIELVASDSAVSANQITAITASLDTTGGNLLVVAVSSFPGGGDATISDTIGGSASGNVWLERPVVYSTPGNRQVQWFYCEDANVGANHVITATLAANAFPVIFGYALSGAGYFFGSASASTDTDTGGISVGPITAAEDGSVHLVAFSCGADISFIDGTGFNATDVLEPGTANSIAAGAAYYIEEIAEGALAECFLTGNQAIAASMIAFSPAGEDDSDPFNPSRNPIRNPIQNPLRYL